MNENDLTEYLSDTKKLYRSFTEIPEYSLRVQDVMKLQIEPDNMAAIVRTANSHSGRKDRDL